MKPKTPKNNEGKSKLVHQPRIAISMKVRRSVCQPIMAHHTIIDVLRALNSS